MQLYILAIIGFFFCTQLSVSAGIIKTKQALEASENHNPLMEAFYSNDLQQAEQLLKQHNNEFNMKEIVLVATLEQGGRLMDEKVALLLCYGTHVALQTMANDTALHTAARYNRWKALQLFLTIPSIDKTLKNGWGQTFLDVLVEDVVDPNLAQTIDCLKKMGYKIPKVGIKRVQ